VENYRCRVPYVTIPTNGHDACWSCGYCTSYELVRGEGSAGAQIRFIRLNWHYLLFAVITLAVPHTLAIALWKLNSYAVKQHLSTRSLYTLFRVNWELSGTCIFRLRSYESTTTSVFVVGNQYFGRTCCFLLHLGLQTEDGGNWRFRGICFLHHQNI